MKKLLFGISGVLLCYSILSSAFIGDQKIRNLMHSFYAQIQTLKPYVVNEEKFKSPEGLKVVKESIKILKNETKNWQSDKIESAPGLNVTFKMLKEHIDKTDKLLQRGETDYARIMINTTTNYCISCHTQIPEPKKGKFSFIDSKSDKEKTLEDAEFLFITRRFDRALATYDSLLRDYPKSGLKPESIPIVYGHKLAIFARVKKDPKPALASLKEDLQNKNLPQDVKNNIESWIEYFANWEKEKTNPATLSDKELLEFAAKNVVDEAGRKIAPADPKAVTYLRISGLLYERLYSRPDSPLMPDMLYYLALCEKNIGILYWYSLSDSYLSMCMTKFPHRPITKKCYDTFEKAVLSRYGTGSAVPEDVKNQLEAYKKYL